MNLIIPLAIVLDLDGTLLHSTKEVSQRNADAIINCYKKGKKMIIATARPPRSVRTFLPDEILELVSFVFYNGAYVTDLREGIEEHISLQQDLSADILEYCNREYPQCNVSVEVMDQWFANTEINDSTLYNLKYQPQILMMEQLQQLEPTKILMTGIDDVRPLQNVFGDQTKIVVTDGGKLIQVMNKGVSKETGILKLCKHYGIKPSEIMVFGDDYNDIEMFRMSGYPVAMQNAIPELKEMAKEITDTNDNDGVAQVLERFI
ncbi:Cof-type HAD-IIB family hydrolase [Paenibacillus sp. YIM B09110]|uniref:Cof-type HAD-IIB family hydrolase n=1 Tax=Paenibacillus sp. YIM B09110 TaxID=3126102 RepID=UPI00301D7EE5